VFFGHSVHYGFPLHFLSLAKNCSPWIVLSNELLCALNKDHMQKLCPQEIDISTNHLGARKTFGVPSSRVRILMFVDFSSLCFWIHDKRPFLASL
jgi:hypothetical protein